MKLLVLALAAGALWAQTAPPAAKPIETTDKEKLEISRAQVDILTVLQQMKQAEDAYNQQVQGYQNQLRTMQPALDKAFAEVRTAHKCEGCSFDKDLNLVKPPESPKLKPDPPKKP